MRVTVNDNGAIKRVRDMQRLGRGNLINDTRLGGVLDTFDNRTVGDVALVIVHARMPVAGGVNVDRVDDVPGFFLEDLANDVVREEAVAAYDEDGGGEGRVPGWPSFC